MTVEPIPPVINLEGILSPVSEENPSGESLRYHPIYDEIKEARRADKDDAQGQWKVELKVADFRRVIELAEPVLENQSKDLQIAVWLSEALVKQHGFAGLRDGLKMIGCLQEIFWGTLYPEVEDGDEEGRANAVTWLDDQISFATKEVPLIQTENYGFFDYEDSKRFDFPDNLDVLLSADQERYKKLQVQADAEKRVTGEMWRKAKSNSRRVFYEELSVVIDECWAEYNELNRVIEEKFDRNQAPGLNELKKSLDGVQTLVKKLLEDKRAEEPDESDEVPGAEQEGGGETGATSIAGGSGVSTTSGAIQNRKDALKRLSDLAVFFNKTEPHSPISYLIQRAVTWGEMSLERLLMDVIKDESVMSELRQTLGFNTSLTDPLDDADD